MSKVRNEARQCPSCGHAWLGPNSSCPQCGKTAKSDGSEITKKVIDDNDLYKAN